MPTSPDDTNGGYTEEIFGTTVYEVPKIQKKIFLPWHKPRKQFVRHHQWCMQIDKLLTMMQPDNGTLKYLGLPGNDLLDLRHFHSEVCEPQKLKLRFLGFNRGADPASEDQTELNISLDEVRKLAMIDPRSDIIWDDFCNVADESSTAWRKTKDFGPYDIINLDLCDGFGKHEPGKLDNNHYNAVNNLFALQSKCIRPWLLFLTTRSDCDNTNEEFLQKLVDKYGKNLAECVPFKEASIETFNIEDLTKLKTVIGTPDGHLAVFMAGICKWILGIAVQHPASVEVKSVIGYRVVKEAPHDDLISFAFRFEPVITPASDPLGLAANISVSPPNECILSAKAVKRLGKRKCADEILAGNNDLLNEMIEATANLLSLARYDANAYREWVKAN